MGIYMDFFCWIENGVFVVLYSKKVSQPGLMVDVLLRLDVLKACFGWSDQELNENYCYELQVRYSMRYDRLGDVEKLP